VADQKGLRLGTILGAPVLLMPSWFAVAAVVTLVYAPQVSSSLPELGNAALAVAAMFALVLLFSVFLHELAHAVAARAVGVPPTHIVLDLWGGHTAFSRELPTPGRSVLVALVGPATNGVIAVVAWMVLGTLDEQGVTRLLVMATATSNAFVALFNALPGLPLDGGRALEGVVWRITGDRAVGTLAAGWCGRAVALALVVWSLVLPLLDGRVPDLTTAIWLLLIAGLLWHGAGQAVAVGRWRRRAPSVTVERLLRPATTVPSAATVADVTAAALAAEVADVVLLDIYGRPAGVIDDPAAATVPAPRTADVAASAVARTLPADAVLDAGLGGDALIERLQATRHPEYAVIDGQGQIIGVVVWQDVADMVAGPGLRRRLRARA
jgi:Zn-dependent protease